MPFWQSFLIGLLSGVAATLIAGHPYVRFRIEKAIRTRLGKPAISVSLRTFVDFCKNGMLLLHCIVLKNNLWFTPTIPKVYFLTEGRFAYDSRCYKPCMYFREHGLKPIRQDVTTKQALQEYGDKIMAYTPGNLALTLNIDKTVPKNIVVICESIDSTNINKSMALDEQSIVGKLHAAVANPMPTISPGARLYMRIISEEFGLIDAINFEVPKNLEELEHLGDWNEVLRMRDRPLCLLDVCEYLLLTWPLRLEIKDDRFRMTRRYPGKF